MVSITINNLVKTFGSETAVEDINLHIEDGELITLVGPSGCGKTTTLRLIAGLEDPDTGTIRFDDEDVTDYKPSKRNVGMVFQDLAIYPHMTVRENMEFGLKIDNIPSEDRERRVRDTAAMLDISDLLDRTPANLSGGQQQRVAIGRTLVLEPDVFLLDEPLASLDAKLRVEIRQEIQKLQNEIDITTIYVTHDQEQAMTMSDRIAVLNDGRLQQFSTPEEVYSNPQNEFIAGFIGTPSINYFDCTLSKSNGAIIAETGFANIPLGIDDESLTGQSLKLACRPEDIFMADEAPETPGNFAAKVNLVEYNGSQQFVHFEVDDREFIAIFSGEQDIQMGEEYPVSFDADRIHLFENTEDGARVY